MTKIWYPVKTEFLPFTCEDITVVMTTSVSAKSKLEAKSKLVMLNVKVTLNNSGLLILCIFIQAHNKVRKLPKKKEKEKVNTPYLGN